MNMQRNFDIYNSICIQIRIHNDFFTNLTLFPIAPTLINDRVNEVFIMINW